MRLIDDILCRLSLDENLVFGGVKYLILDGHSGYFESIEGVMSFTSTEICLTIKKGCLKVVGDSLMIKKYSGKDLIVVGNIKRVERLG